MLFLNNEEVKITKFPNGETLIKVEDLSILEENEVKLKYIDDRDITHLIFLKNYLDEKDVKVSLTLGYIPYSRMDRTEGITVFTLKYLCKVINSLNFTSVKVYEPHSEVSIALLDRVEVVNMSEVLAKECIEDLKEESLETYLIYPDAGAEKRYAKRKIHHKTLTASKERDFNTGVIKRLDIHGDIPKGKFNAVIIDDLCSRGGTFMLTGQKLKELGAEDIYLVVTHCEDTIFQGDILKTDIIKKIYTTDSILTISDPRINVKKIF